MGVSPRQDHGRGSRLGAGWFRARLAAGALIGLALAADAVAQADPFALRPPVTEYAAFSCQALVVDGNSQVSSKGIPANSKPTNLGHVRANQGITVKGNGKVMGNATPGPGFQVTLQGNGSVTGATTPAAQTLGCYPIDLVALKTALLAANDNSSIPRTSKNKNPLGGTDGRELTVTANDTLALPAGTFLFSKMTISANAKVTLAGNVKILCYGTVSVASNAELNAAANPYKLRLWVSGTQVSIDSNAKMHGYIYAPDAPLTLQANGDYYGAVFAKSVILQGNAKLKRPIDDQAPTLTVSSPAEGQTVSSCSMQVAGQVTDAQTAATLTVNGVTVQVQSDGSFSTTAVLTPATGGVVTVVAHDQGGGETTVVRHVVPPQPAVALVTPAPASVVGQSVVDLAGTVSAESTVTVDSTPAVASAGAWTLAGYALGADGPKNLSLVARSCGGTATVPVVLDVDTLAPAVGIDTPANGSTTQDESVTVAGPVTDAHLVSVVVQVNGAAPGVLAAVNAGRFTAGGVPLAIGANQIMAVATDALGRATPASISVTRQSADADPPVVTLTQPGLAAGACLPAGQPVTVSGTYADANPATGQGGQPQPVVLEVTPSGGSLVTVPAVLAGDGHTWSAAGVDLGAVDGTAQITVVASDALGHVARVPFSFPIDAAAPTLQLTLDGAPFPGQASGEAPPAGTQPVLFSRTVAARVTVTETPTTPTPAATLTLDGAPYQPGALVESEGDHLLVARVADCAGRQVAVHALLRLDLVDPVLHLTEPALQAGACLPAAQPVTVSGTYADATPASGQGGQAQAVVLDVLPAGGAPFVVQATLAADGHTWSATGVDLGSADGAAVVTAIASDAAGHTARISRSFPIDAAPPTVQLTLDGAPFPGQAAGEVPPAGAQPVLLSRIVSPRVTVTDAPATPPAVPQLTLDGAAYVAGTPIGDAGQHLLVARVTDCAGRQIAAHALFRLDLTGPALLSTTPDNGANLNDGPSSYAGTSDPDLAKATVNGVQAQVSQGAFTLAPVAWMEGSNQVEIGLEDQAGHRATYHRTYTVRSVNLSLQILESGRPIGSGSVFTRSVMPELRASDPEATITATLNGATYVAGTAIAATGTYALQATATDALGRTATATAAFEVDVEAPPTVSITSPANGVELPFAQVTATGTVTGATPTVTVNGVSAAITGGTWSVALTLEPDVLNTLTATAVDGRGRSAQDVVTVMVRTGAPKLVIVEPAEGTLTNRSAIDVAGGVIGGPSAIPSGSVSVGTATAMLDTSGGFRALDVPLQEGVNTLTAQAADGHGRVGQASVTVTSDRTPPAVLVLADGQTLADGVTLSQTTALRVQVTDSSGFADTPTVRLDGEAFSAPGGVFETTVSADGGHVVEVVATDGAGNQTRLLRSFNVALGGCAISDLQPPSGSTFAASTFTLRGRSGSASAVRVVVSGTPAQELLASLADGTFVAADLPLPVLGDNTFSVVCVDAIGQPHSQSLVIRRLAEDSGPVVTITSPSNGGWTGEGTSNVSGTVSDPSAVVTVNGAATTAPAGGAFARSGVPLVEGPNVIVARASDSVGRSGRDRVVVWRDSLAPRVAITAPEARTHVGVAPGGAATADVTGQVDLSSEPNLSTVTVSAGLGSVSATVDPATGVFVASAVPLDAAAGSGVLQTVTVTAADTLGHVSTATTSAYVDPSGPAIVLTTPGDLSFVTSATQAELVVSGEAWGHEGAVVTINGVQLDPATLAWDAAGADGLRHVAFSASVGVPGSDGPFGVIARSSDQGGDAAQVRRTIMRDTTAPRVVEVVPADGSTGVDRDSLVMVLLSEAVRPPSLAAPDGFRLVRVSTGEVVTGQTATAGLAAAFVPAAALAPGESYRLEIGGGVQDLAGNALQPTTAATFTVALAGTGAPPALDPLPPVLCASEVTVAGTASPGATVRVADGSLRFSTSADATGRFSVRMPLGTNGYHLLRVVEIDRAGFPVGRETVAVVRLDCSAPSVVSATFDRNAGLVRIVFSERMSASTVTFGSADSSLRLSDAETGQLGTGSLTLPSDGVNAEIAVPVGSGVWWEERPVRLWVGPTCADERGNPMAAAFETVFAASGQEGLAGAFLSGEAFDDLAGRPLAGASALLFASGAALPGTVPVGSTAAPVVGAVATDGRGRYTITDEVSAGRYVLVLQRDGYTRVVRRLALEPAIGAVPFDGRLTPLAAPAGTLDLAAGGTFEADGLRLDAAAGAVPGSGSVDVRLTTLSAQGLPDFLPLGWTPAAAAELRLEAAGVARPEGAATPFAADGVHLTVALPAWVQPADTLVAVRYDLAAGAWLVLPDPERLTATDGSALGKVSLPGPGTVALILADADPATAPPQPDEPGDLLRGVAQPEEVPVMTAELALDPPVVAPTGRATARVVARSGDPAAVWPSGLAVQAFLDERLVIAGGGELREAPFGADLVLYHPRLDTPEIGSNAPGGVGEVRFAVSPSPRAAQVLLEIGWENIRLFPFPGQLERGQLLGPAGGSITSPDGVEVTLPEGALLTKTVVTADLLSDAEIAALAPVQGFDIVGAVRLELADQTLRRPATLRIPLPSTVPPADPADPRLVLAEQVDAPADGRAAFARLIARVTRAAATDIRPEHAVAAPELPGSALPLEGVVREGLYLVLHAQAPIGFASGFVRSATGHALAAARATADGLGTAELSRDGGRYTLVVPAGNGKVVRAQHPTLDEAGSATIATLATGAIAQVDITIRPVPPSIVSLQPPDGALDQPVGSVAAVQLSEALDPTSVGASTLSLELLSGSGEPTGVMVLGTVSQPDPTRVAFTPQRPLPPGRPYRARFVGGVRDLGGVPYDGSVPVTWTFTTSMVAAPGGQVHPEKFHARLPSGGTVAVWGDDGAVPTVPTDTTPWAIKPEIEGPVADTVQVTCQADTTGGFGRNPAMPCTVGHPPAFAATIKSRIWVRVFDPQGVEAAYFRLGPFTSEDGKTVVAPPGEATTFTTPEGIKVEIPAAAFTEATAVTVSTLDPATIGVPTPAGVLLGGYVSVDFDGVANETLRLSLPAPATAAVGARVIVAEPADLPWGRKLKLLTIGAVVERDGQRWMTNDPATQPEPSTAPNPSQGTGDGLLDGGSGAQTCAQARQQGLPKCFFQSVFMEFQARTNAAWFAADVGAGFALVTGGVSMSLGAQFEALYNSYAASWVFVPTPHNWNGHYVLPVPANQPLRIVRRDLATGWIVTEKDYDPIPPSTIGLIEKGLIEGSEKGRPLVVSASPFTFVRFRAPRPGQTQPLTLEIEAEADSQGRVTLKAVPEYPLAEGTWLEVWDYGPALPADPNTQAKKPKPALDPCKASDCLPSSSFAPSDELVLIIHPPSLEWTAASSFELQLDRSLDGLKDDELPSLFKLTDLTDNVEVAVLCEIEAARTRLVVTPDGFLTAGHEYRLEITQPEKLRTASGQVFWGEPHQFRFGTRTLTGEPVTERPPQGLLALGDTNEARDMLPFGDLILVGSATGRILAIDRTTAASSDQHLGKYRIRAIRNGQDQQVRAFAADTHNRLFYAAAGGSTWVLQTVRVEDVEHANLSACFNQPAWASELPCFGEAGGGVRISYTLGYGSGTTGSEWLALGTLPSGTPTDLELLEQEETGPTLERDAFYTAYEGSARTDLGGGLERLTVTLHQTTTPTPACSDEAGVQRSQRVTVDNLTTRQSVSFDVTGSRDVQLEVRAGDRLRVRHNLNTFGYLAVIGSGLAVVDLNRAYAVPMSQMQRGVEQCGRYLSGYQGQDVEWPACACPGGTAPACTNINGLSITPAVAPISQTGDGSEDNRTRGVGAVDVFSPRTHVGLVHTSSSTTEPGTLAFREVDACLTQVGGATVQLRDIAVVPDVTWIDRGILGTSAGTFTGPPNDFKPREKTGDLMLVSLGPAGVLVYDVSDRTFSVIGRLHVAGHSIYRLAVDYGRSLLFAGGLDAKGVSVIDIWDLHSVNSAPGKPKAPRPVATVNAPWTTPHLVLDPFGTGLLDTWNPSKGAVAVPYNSPQFELVPIVAPEEGEDGGLEADEKAEIVPSGIPADPDPEKKATSAFRVRVALPQSLGESLTAKVQALRARPDDARLADEDIGALVAMPGGPGWPEREVYVTLERQTDRPTVYLSKEIVVLLADPRARREYTLQDIPEGSSPHADDADEKAQCRRCEWPEKLKEQRDNLKELLAGGPWVRVLLAVDPDSSGPIRTRTEAALEAFEHHTKDYRAPRGIKALPGWADAVPSPIQVSLAEPALNAAMWALGEAGVGASLVAGEAILEATDFSWQGRGLDVALDRTYRSGTLGYGPFGAAGWHSSLLAHLREIGTTGEVEYRDGTGHVYRFLGPTAQAAPSTHEADDFAGQYSVPKGLLLRLRNLGPPRGWTLIDRFHNRMLFDPDGRLTEIQDRHRRLADSNEQGNTTKFLYDNVGQLVRIEDDYGRPYTLEYYVDPRPVPVGDGPRYGLLKKVTDFAGRTIEYEYDTDRRLAAVKLPEVANPAIPEYSHAGANRPTVKYQYDPAANVTSSEADTTAILHGEFAPLRLEGFTQPASQVMRARFEFSSATGRVTKIGVPTRNGANAPGSSVAWSLGYPDNQSDAKPATKATVTLPWGKCVEHALDPAGHTNKVRIAAVEALTLGAEAPGPGAPMPTVDLETTYEYESDGRLARINLEPDHATTSYSYPASSGSKDRLASANVTQVKVEQFGQPTLTRTIGYDVTDVNGQLVDVSPDNIPTRTTDGADRKVIQVPAIATDRLKLGSAPKLQSGLVGPGAAGKQVSTGTAHDQFGRPKQSEGKTSGDPDAPPSSTSITYSAEPSKQAQGGFPGTIQRGGETLTLTYDIFGNLSGTASALGGTEVTNDAWNRPIKEVTGQQTGAYAAVNATVERGFDAAGRLVKERRQQQGLGLVETTYEYNARDQVTKIAETKLAGSTAGAGATANGASLYAYDLFGRLETTTTPEGRVTTLGYDSLGRQTTSKLGSGASAGTTRVGYDPQGRVVYTFDGHEGIWRGRYNAHGQLISELLPGGAVVKREYDGGGLLTAETVYPSAYEATEPASRLAMTIHDQSEWPNERTRTAVVLGPTVGEDVYFETVREYDAEGRLRFVKSKDENGGDAFELGQSYEAGTGRLLRRKDAFLNTTEYTYPGGVPVPSQVKVMEKNGPTLTATLGYDALGRVTSQEVGGTTTTSRYDEVGNVLSTTAAGLTTTMTYDSRGSLLSAVGPGEQSTQLGYDLDGQMTTRSVLRATGSEVTQYTYAPDTGWLQSIAHPGNQSESFTYDPDGLVKTHRTRLGITLTATHDAANRPQTVVPSGIVPAGTAALDWGISFGYDALGRPTSVARKTGEGPNDVDTVTQVTYSQLNGRGQPRFERVGLWGSGVIQRTYALRGWPKTVKLPAEWGAASDIQAFSQQFDALDRLTGAAGADGNGTAIPDTPLRVTHAWAGTSRLLSTETAGPSAVVHTYAFRSGDGRLGSLDLARQGAGVGSLGFTWDQGADWKSLRAASGPANAPNLLAGQGWFYYQDGTRRLRAADRLGAEGSVDRWTFGYGPGDELSSADDGLGHLAAFTSGIGGRIETRVAGGESTAFSYDPEGKRIADERFEYTYDWEGHLVQVDVKPTLPASAKCDAAQGRAPLCAYRGHRLTYQYDATGRLLTRTHRGVPNDQGERPFRAKRAFVWDTDTLVAEAGLNFEDAITWRRQYLPGPSGLDDAPLVRVEANLQGGGSPDPHLYAVVRDELGSVIGVLDQAPAAGAPALRARVLYTPYGEAHLETGPEPLRLWFDPALTSAGGQTQQIAPPEPPATESGAIPGGLRLTTTAGLDPASVTAGLGVERYDPASGSWVAVAPTEIAAGLAASEETELDLVLLAGWPKGGQIRITMRPALADGFGRAFQVPAGEDPAGVRVVVTVPASGSAPDLDRRWPLRFDSGYAAANSLGGAFPDGQTSLYQGLWTDPVTGIAYARARWYDARTASWLSEDPEQTLDSPNLYAYVAWQPQMARDPSGRSAWTKYRSAKEAIGSVFANARVQGTMQVLQGAMEIGVGVAASESGVGLLAVAHGSDTSAAGLVALITGEAQTTATHQAARDVALLAGADEGVAEQMGYWTDMAVGTAASIGAARAVAARAPPVVRGGGAAAAPKSAVDLSRYGDLPYIERVMLRASRRAVNRSLATGARGSEAGFLAEEMFETYAYQMQQRLMASGSSYRITAQAAGDLATGQRVLARTISSFRGGRTAGAKILDYGFYLRAQGGPNTARILSGTDFTVSLRKAIAAGVPTEYAPAFPGARLFGVNPRGIYGP